MKVSTNANRDFGWICVKVFEQKELCEEFLDTTNLYEAVLDHYNSLLPHPGYPASSAELSNSFVEIEMQLRLLEQALGSCYRGIGLVNSEQRNPSTRPALEMHISHSAVEDLSSGPS